jgi:hypothetical protein
MVTKGYLVVSEVDSVLLVLLHTVSSELEEGFYSLVEGSCPHLLVSGVEELMGRGMRDHMGHRGSLEEFG